MNDTHTKVLKKLDLEDLGQAALVCNAWREVGGIIDCSFVIKDETPAMQTNYAFGTAYALVVVILSDHPSPTPTFCTEVPNVRQPGSLTHLILEASGSENLASSVSDGIFRLLSFS